MCCLSQVLFCSVSGDIFPKEAEQKRADLGLQHSIDAKDAYLQRLLAAVIPSISPPEAVLHKAAANNEGELLDACKYGLLNLVRDSSMLTGPNCSFLHFIPE